jgi:hypothetical protein
MNSSDEASSIEEANEELFVSEYVDETVDSPKTYLHSFDKDKILAVLPYHDIVYVSICPKCIKVDEFSLFKTLVQRKAITPILTAPYKSYDDNISEYVYAHDHMNTYEFSAFKYLSLMEDAEGGVCRHCIQKWKTETSQLLNKSAKLKEYRRSTSRLAHNLYPYISPDYEILEEFKAALKSRDIVKINILSEMSEAINSIRTSQAFNSPINISSLDLSSLPKGFATESDRAISISNNLNMDVANGLGLKIPSDIEIEAYLDIVENFRPLIMKQVESVIKDGDGETLRDPSKIQREIMNINSEIDRVSKSRRYMILEACSDFYGKNSALVNATLLAGAFGMAGSLAGCVGGPAASGAVGAFTSGLATVAKRKKWVVGGGSIDRLSNKISADLQPFLSKIASLYVGSTPPVVNVMSLRTQISSTAHKDR